MKINKAEFQKALRIVKPGLASKELIEQSTSFAFKDGRVVTYNDEVCISHPVEGLEIQGAVRSKLFYEFIGKIKKDEIEIEMTKNELRIKSGRSKAGVPVASEVILPLEEVDKIGKWKKLDEQFIPFMVMAANAAAKDMGLGKFTCVYVDENGSITGSDNLRILYSTVNDGFGFPSFLIPAQSAKKAASIEPTKISVTKNWVHFTNNEGTILSCRIYPDEYEDVSEFVEMEGMDFEFPKTVDTVLDRAAIFSKTETIADEEVEFIVAKNRMTIKAKGPNGWFEEPINYKYSDEPFSFTIVPYLLKDILSRAHTCIVNENGLKFTGAGWVYLSALKSMDA